MSHPPAPTAASSSRPTTGGRRALFQPTLSSDSQQQQQQQRWQDKQKQQQQAQKEAQAHANHKAAGRGMGGAAAHKSAHKQKKADNKAPTFLTPPRILSKASAEQQQQGTAGHAPPAYTLAPPHILKVHEEHAQIGASAAVSPATASPSPSPSPLPASTPAAAKPAASTSVPPLLYHRPIKLWDERLKLLNVVRREGMASAGVEALEHVLFSSSAPMPSAPASSSSSASPVAHPCDFTVYGVIGTQQSGKSTLINALARPHDMRQSAPSPPTASTGEVEASSFVGSESTRPTGFPTADREHVLSSLHQTSGIDVLITPERNILLDTQPVDSASVWSKLMRSTAPLPPNSPSSDTLFHMHTIHTVLTLLNCCHVLLVVCEADTLLLMSQLLQRALLIRQQVAMDAPFLARSALPSSASPSPSTPSSFHSLPDIVFVVNKVPLAHMCASESCSYTSLLSRLLVHAPFRKNGWINTFTPRIGVDGNEVVNCFQLPFCEETARGSVAKGGRGGESPLSSALQELTAQLLTLPKLGLTQRMTERDWLRHVQRVAHDLATAPALAEYQTLLQQSLPRPLSLHARIERPTKTKPGQGGRGAHGHPARFQQQQQQQQQQAQQQAQEHKLHRRLYQAPPT